MLKSDEFLLIWLNEEIKLNPPVKNIRLEFSTGYRFAEILYSINEITEKEFKLFSNSSSRNKIKDNFILLKKYFKDKFELEVRKEEFNDIKKKDISKAVIILYKLKNSISKKKIHFHEVKISLNPLTQEEIHQKVKEIIDYEYFYDIYSKDLLYDIINEEKNNYQYNKYNSSTIKSFNSSYLYQSNSLLNKMSVDSIREKPEMKRKLTLIKRNRNINDFLNNTQSKKIINKLKLPNINNMNKSTQIMSPNRDYYINTEQNLNPKNINFFITNNYEKKYNFGNGKPNIAEENKFTTT